MKRILLLFGLAFVVLLSGCAVPRYELHTVKVGLVATFSGSTHREGGRWLTAAKIAIEEWNTANAEGTYRIELVASDQAEGPVVARRQVLDPDILAVVGYSSATILGPQREVYAAAGMPVLAMVATGEPREGERFIVLPLLSSPDDVGETFAQEYRRRWGEAPNLAAATVYLGIKRLLAAYEVALQQGNPTRDSVWAALQTYGLVL